MILAIVNTPNITKGVLDTNQYGFTTSRTNFNFRQKR